MQIISTRGLHGFGSEFNLLVRAASLAQQLSYTLAAPDSSHWNYGSFVDYFEPIVPDCNPPKDTYHRTSMIFPSSTGGKTSKRRQTLSWTKKQHVMWSKRDLEGLDRTVLESFTNEKDVAQLHVRELERLDRIQAQARDGPRLSSIVSSPHLVPEPYLEAFRSQSDIARALWQPNGDINKMVSQTKAALGLGNDRKTRQHGDTTPVDELVIGVHVRLGDKYLETSRIGPQAYDKQAVAEPSPTTKPGLHAELVELYLRAAVESVDSLLAGPNAYRSSSTKTEQWQGRPTLIVMSDDPEAYKVFERHVIGQRFRVVATPPPPPPSHANVYKRQPDTNSTAIAAPADFERAEALKKKEAKWRLIKRRKLGRRADPEGFNERSFNLMTERDRIAQSKVFVRDVTLLSQDCDALVVTASSNVGRLLMLLAGEDMSLQGRVRSIDTRWFPTSQFY
ncbi:hypothetical protein OIO90_000992 [Microbotryomycetes sp. JL221]|nr:hypothetical protein OIO90_000992 [Microbotryomycetes sp. JL221]